MRFDHVLARHDVGFRIVVLVQLRGPHAPAVRETQIHRRFVEGEDEFDVAEVGNCFANESHVAPGSMRLIPLESIPVGPVVERDRRLEADRACEVAHTAISFEDCFVEHAVFRFDGCPVYRKADCIVSEGFHEPHVGLVSLLKLRRDARREFTEVCTRYFAACLFDLSVHERLLMLFRTRPHVPVATGTTLHLGCR